MVPPNSSTARDMRVTHSPTRAFTSSGPRRSPSAVDPTTSANRAVIGRISSPSLPWGRGTAVPGPGTTASSAGTGVPHAGQNRAPEGIRVPQAAQVNSPISTTSLPEPDRIVPGSPAGCRGQRSGPHCPRIARRVSRPATAAGRHRPWCRPSRRIGGGWHRLGPRSGPTVVPSNGEGARGGRDEHQRMGDQGRGGEPGQLAEAAGRAAGGPGGGRDGPRAGLPGRVRERDGHRRGDFAQAARPRHQGRRRRALPEPPAAVTRTSSRIEGRWGALPPALRHARELAQTTAVAPWHFLYLRPEPHGHGAFRPILSLMAWGAAPAFGSSPWTVRTRWG